MKSCSWPPTGLPCCAFATPEAHLDLRASLVFSCSDWVGSTPPLSTPLFLFISVSYLALPSILSARQLTALQQGPPTWVQSLCILAVLRMLCQNPLALFTFVTVVRDCNQDPGACPPWVWHLCLLFWLSDEGEVPLCLWASDAWCAQLGEWCSARWMVQDRGADTPAGLRLWLLFCLYIARLTTTIAVISNILTFSLSSYWEHPSTQTPGR